MPAIVAFTLVLAAALGALAWFVRLERAGRSITVLIVVLGLVVMDSSLYWSPNEVPFGLFHPRVGPLNFRLVDVIIPAAMAARLIGGRVAPRLSTTSLVWMAALVWIATAGLLGLLYGNDIILVAFEGKIVLYLGVMTLAAGIPIGDYVHARPMLLLLRLTSACAGGLIVMNLLGIRLSVDITLLPLTQVGNIGGDGATVFATLGLFALALSLYSDSGRRALLITSLPLLAAPLLSTQRAALLGLGVGIAAIAVTGFMGPARVRIPAPELLVAVLAIMAVLLLPGYVSALAQRPATIPLTARLEQDLANREKQLSAEDRINQWRRVQQVIAERPLFGWGLGTSYVYWDPGQRQLKETFLAHDIWLDLLLRSGMVGLVLFACAVVTSLIAAAGVIRSTTSPLTLAVAVGSMAIVLGLLAKGTVESIFEKYRLAILLGAFIGVLLSARAATDDEWRPQYASPAAK
jgi:O-antigen ligase